MWVSFLLTTLTWTIDDFFSDLLFSRFEASLLWWLLHFYSVFSMPFLVVVLTLLSCTRGKEHLHACMGGRCDPHGSSFELFIVQHHTTQILFMSQSCTVSYEKEKNGR
jgi:hypothetical protein